MAKPSVTSALQNPGCFFGMPPVAFAAFAEEAGDGEKRAVEDGGADG